MAIDFEPPRILSESPLPYINDSAKNLLSFECVGDSVKEGDLTAEALVQSQKPSIWEWARQWSLPQIRPLWLPPPADNEDLKAKDFKGNTTNTAYDKLLNEVLHWNIDVDQILDQFPVLNLPFNYDHPGLHGRCEPLTNQLPIDAPYWRECGLVSRLDSLLFPNLRRVQTYLGFIRALNTNEQGGIGLDYVPVFDCSGGDGYHQDFLPDRCGLESDYQVYHKGRTFGDIKPSFKFDASWINNDAHKTAQKEHKQAVSQVTYYMRKLGKPAPNSEDKKCTARYGYIITEKEVVLVSQIPGERKKVQATEGFPFQFTENNPPPPGTLSGMQALIYIHLISGTEEGWIYGN